MIFKSQKGDRVVHDMGSLLIINRRGSVGFQVFYDNVFLGFYGSVETALGWTRHDGATMKKTVEQIFGR